MSLSPGDISSIIRASVLSDDAREVGGAIDAKLSLAIDRVIRRVEGEIAAATESLENGVLRAVERVSGRMQATPDISIEPGLSSELLQEIYRAAREEIGSLRADLQKQIRGLVQTELQALDGDRPQPLSEAQAKSIADESARLAVQSHAETQPAPLTEERVREIAADLIHAAVREAIEHSESSRPPVFGRDEAAAVAREVADAAVSVHAAAQPVPAQSLTEEDVHRIVTEFFLAQEIEVDSDDAADPGPPPVTEAQARAIAAEAVSAAAAETAAVAEAPSPAAAQLAEEWGGGLPEWLQVAIVQTIGNSTGVFAAAPEERGAAVDPDQLEAAVAKALSDNPPQSAAFELAQLWRDGLPSWMVAIVKQAAGGTAEFDEIALRQMILDVVRAEMPLDSPAQAPAPAAEGALAPGAAAGVVDEQRLRILIRTEMAEMIAELPHAPSEAELRQLIESSVDRALDERPAPEPAAAAAAVDDKATRDWPREAETGPQPGETGVFVSKMRLIMDQLLDEKLQDRATHDEVDKVVTRRLLAATPMAAEGATAAGDGLSAADVKRLVREIIEAEIPNRDEVEKMIRRLS